MLRLFVPVALASTTLLAPRLATADQCSSARVMVVLDKSSSMQTGSINGATKWSIAVDGLATVLGTYETQAEFGLMTFPQPSQCSPGALDVAPALSNRQAILDSLVTPPPEAGSYTPMAQTLQVAATETSLSAAATGGARHVILITDGWQWCYPYDPATRFDGTPAVEQLNAEGVTTWIVGFGDSVDSVALNRMAVAANTARMGCDPTSTDPTSPNNCYFQVDDATQLVTALNAIAGTISAEICDGIDNDCDGEIDEGLVRSCSSACGVGEEVCSAGQWGACDLPAVDVEVCDGIDNDCNGEVDEPTLGMCSDGEICSNGTCQPTNEQTPDEGGGEMQAGCACSTSAIPDAGAFAPFAALGLILLRRRRR